MKTAVYRDEDHELMGHVQEQDGMYAALTIFGYPIAKGLPEIDAINMLLDKGLSVLAETWEYRESVASEWQKCLLIEVSENLVKIALLDDINSNTPNVIAVNGNISEKLKR